MKTSSFLRLLARNPLARPATRFAVPTWASALLMLVVAAPAEAAASPAPATASNTRKQSAIQTAFGEPDVLMERSQFSSKRLYLPGRSVLLV
jgi:hypothetical protein